MVSHYFPSRYILSLSELEKKLFLLVTGANLRPSDSALWKKKIQKSTMQYPTEWSVRDDNCENVAYLF